VGRENAFGYGYIIGERYRRVLSNADLVAAFLENPVDLFPTGTSTKPPWTRTTSFTLDSDVLFMMVFCFVVGFV